MAVAEAESSSVGVGMQWTIGAGEAGDRANDIGCARRHTFPDWGVAVSARCQTLQSTRPCWRCDRGRDGGGGGYGGCDVKCLGAGAGAGGGEVDAEAMQCDRRRRTAQRRRGDEQVSEQEGVNPVGNVRARFVAKKRVSGPARDSAGSALLQRSPAQCSGVNGAAGEKCWGVLLAAFAQVQIAQRTKRQTAFATGLDVSSRPLFRRIFGLVLGPLRS
jgi:hypothetical protein